METKQCTKCDTVKSVSEFYPTKRADRPGEISSTCKACDSAKAKIYRAKNKKMVLAKSAAYHAKTLEYQRERKKRYYAKKKNDIIKKSISYAKKRRASDPQFCAKDKLRCSLYNYIVKSGKSKRMLEYTGLTSKQLRIHFELLFTKGMTWENRGVGGWEIDHIIPCCKFDLTDESEIKKCFHWTNLQPLWASDNKRKWIKTHD